MTVLPDLALSIRQPWAWAIISAGKDIENRTWRAGQRGPICIHASAGMTRAEYADAAAFMQSLGVDTPHSAALLRGGIIGVAEIVGCVNRSDSPWFFGPQGFVLRDARAMDFIPCRGALGFFSWKASQ
jgi:hypothetical protein